MSSTLGYVAAYSFVRGSISFVGCLTPFLLRQFIGIPGLHTGSFKWRNHGLKSKQFATVLVTPAHLLRTPVCNGLYLTEQPLCSRQAAIYQVRFRQGLTLSVPMHPPRFRVSHPCDSPSNSRGGFRPPDHLFRAGPASKLSRDSPVRNHRR